MPCEVKFTCFSENETTLLWVLLKACLERGELGKVDLQLCPLQSSEACNLRGAPIAQLPLVQ